MNIIQVNQIYRNFKKLLVNAVRVDEHRTQYNLVATLIAGYLYAIKDNTDLFNSRAFYNKILEIILDETNVYNSQKVRLSFIDLLDKIVS